MASRAASYCVADDNVHVAQPSTLPLATCFHLQFAIQGIPNPIPRPGVTSELPCSTVLCCVTARRESPGHRLGAGLNSHDRA